MGYYISHTIGIRTGGVFSGETDMEDMRRRIAKIIQESRGTDWDVDMGDDPSHCMSAELCAHKGSYVMLAGVFNYWNFARASEFVRRLSEEFGTEIMHMAWDEERDTVQCQIWLDGAPLFEMAENPLGRVLRRLT